MAVGMEVGVASDRPPITKMYLVVWEKDGERQATCFTHAFDPTDAVARALAIYTTHPEAHFPRREGMAVRAIRLARVDSNFIELPQASN
jgi:hypothetical protein